MTPQERLIEAINGMTGYIDAVQRLFDAAMEVALENEKLKKEKDD